MSDGRSRIVIRGMIFFAPTLPLREINSRFMSKKSSAKIPDASGHFGPYGGRFVPETLMHPLQELEDEYLRAQKDPEFQARVRVLSPRILSAAPRRCTSPNA